MFLQYLWGKKDFRSALMHLLPEISFEVKGKLFVIVHLCNRKYDHIKIKRHQIYRRNAFSRFETFGNISSFSVSFEE